MRGVGPITSAVTESDPGHRPSARQRPAVMLAVTLLIFAQAASVAPLAPAPVRASDGGHVIDISRMDYTPIGRYGPTAVGGAEPTIPLTTAAGTLDPNPSGKWVAYDTNVFESITYPNRHPGDVSAAETSGNGGADYGFCPEDPAGEFGPWGKCDDHPQSGNHQLEYLDYFEQQMTEMLSDFGVVIHRYGFTSPGTGARGGLFDAANGQAWNIAAVVPGAEHPDETVLISGHYDFTDSGPAAAWDSSEGHAEVMRVAAIMADYWRATGTRPSATVKFVPWDSEESGTWGSLDYVRNNIPPGQEHKVRGYFNMDPCAGAYPAFRRGVVGDRVPEVLQLTNPAIYPQGSVARERVAAFNTRAETIVDEVFDNLDDTIQTPAGPLPIFVSDAEAAAGHDGARPVPPISQRGEIVTALGGLAAFSSDYRNFAAAGIPIFNLFPDYFGPHADGTPGQSDGVAILHTPRDNLTTINALTSLDSGGTNASEGWAKGMEMCAHIEGWYMLQPEMAGARPPDANAVAYFEALPNEAIQNDAVRFDASGSYRYADPTTRAYATDLSYHWDFGDGTTAAGPLVEHPYERVGRYQATLTVSSGGTTDSMTIPIKVVPSTLAGPVLDPIDAGDAADGAFRLAWTFGGSQDGFAAFSVQESRDFTTTFYDDAEGLITTNWVVEPPTDPLLSPWQASDSLTPKGGSLNRTRSGERSFWTGVTPAAWNPPPTDANSYLVTKEPVSLPVQGDVELSFWSQFQNEGDDQGRIEIAIEDGNPGTPLEWDVLDVIQAVNTALGEDDPYICDPSNDATLNRPMEHRRVSLRAFAGYTVLLRFNYALGPENRVLSQPCGWYVDDVRLQFGTFSEIGTTPLDTTSFQVAGRTNGSYAYRVVGVYTDGVETLPSNVEIAEVTAARADLRVTDIRASNSRAREGDKVTLTATIQNSGGGAAPASQTEFLLDGATVLGVADTGALTGGESRTVSVTWDTRNVKGQHVIRVSADRRSVVDESDESNNSATLTVSVKGNKVQNGSFEQANSDGTGPASWSGDSTDAGTVTWNDGGSHGTRSASASGTGGNVLLAGMPTWTSDPIEVTAGRTYDLVVSVAASGVSSAPSAGLAYLGPAGQVLDSVTLLTAPLTTNGFVVLEEAATIPAGVTSVRVVLTGFSPTDTSTSGTVIFDDVGLFER